MLEFDFKTLRLERPPVFVQADLDLVRTLGMAHIPAIVASSDIDDPAFASRFCTGRCTLPSRFRPDELADAMVEAGKQIAVATGRRVPLMCAADDWLELIYSHRDRLTSNFLLVLNDPEIALGLLTKDRFEPLARALGLPVPRDLAWDELSGTSGPVIVKPRSRSHFYDSVLFAQLFSAATKALIFDSGRKAASEPLVARFKDQLTFQEYVQGDDRQLWSYHGFSDEKGNILASYLGRKIRTWPPLTGQSAFIELIHDPELEAIGRRWAQQVPLKGPFKMDFKKDSRTGQHYLLEVNARFNLWNHLGAANGLNLLQVAYDYLVTGTRPQPLPYRTDTRWICLPHDYRSYRAMAARGELSFFSWVCSVASTRRVHKHMAWNDPVPFIVKCTHQAMHIGRRLQNALLTRLRKWLSTAS